MKLAKSPSITVEDVLPPLPRSSSSEWLPEDVQPGDAVGTGRVLAIFHDYGRAQPILCAFADGTAKGMRSDASVQVRSAPAGPRCQHDCGAQDVAAGLVWLLRHQYGKPAELTVRPRFVEDAVDVAEAWNLIRRDRSLTGAGRIWLLEHCRRQGEELDPMAAERRPVNNNNYIDARGATGMNVIQGGTGPVTVGAQVQAGTDVQALSQILNLLRQNQHQLELRPDDRTDLLRAMKQLQESVSAGNPHTPAAAGASRTILGLARDVLVKVAPAVALAVLERIAG